MGHKKSKSPKTPLSKHTKLLLCLPLLLLLFLSLHLPSTLLRRANYLGRRCLPEQPTTSYSAKPLKIAMVSFSDEGEGARSFRGMGELVGRNKRSYAERMGYDFVDGRGLVDPRRPPSWSKILAVQFYLDSYDWVFWNDADTLVANPDISLENILRAAVGHLDFHSSPDLVVTEDINSVNSGVFFARRSEWSKHFLDKWWNQTSFIQFGSTKSGDNAAMNHLIDSLSPEERRTHVHVSSMQCLFNSYYWNPTWRSAFRFFSSPHTMWKGTYSKGDFLVHLAGFDNKKEWTIKILQEIEADG